VLEEEDHGLITRIALEDQDAFIALYTRYRPKLRRYLWYHLWGNNELVEEAIQDTFLHIWRGAVTYRGDAQVATWIFRITYRCMQQLRRATSRDQRHQSAFTTDIFSVGNRLSHATPENHVIERMTFDDAMQHLSEKHREILELIFEFGFSQEEVAQVLAIPRGTVKSRISYARRALRRQLMHMQEEEHVCQD
jgi:RNA polymerase sigma-70 factor (ECF subfamily)